MIDHLTHFRQTEAAPQGLSSLSSSHDLSSCLTGHWVPVRGRRQRAEGCRQPGERAEGRLIMPVCFGVVEEIQIVIILAIHNSIT